MTDYERIAAAIEYIVAHGETQPGLAEVAAHAALSPFHFQRVFSRWAGVTPKRFLQVVSVERAKRLLGETSLPALAVSERVGFSSVSRLHDHFVNLEAVTPAEFKRGGRDLVIGYGTTDTPFGRAFIAATPRGIVKLAFLDQAGAAAPLQALSAAWPGARLDAADGLARALGERVFSRARHVAAPLSVVVRGTNFQVSVWRALLEIPPAAFAAYGDVATAIGRPRAVRAVGTAVGANPCAFLIPCHRVIRGSGELGGYRWGETRKRAINAWEAAGTDGMLRSC
jgi:AraC family transcriptional regulator of adaptative response/methylated-DNA-[protein]-cysteine methyltransferase